MSDRVPNEFMMIGLHKLAAERGDGLVPELMALFADRRRQALENENVLRFPDELASPASRHVAQQTAGNDNVIAFTPYLAQKGRVR